MIMWNKISWEFVANVKLCECVCWMNRAVTRSSGTLSLVSSWVTADLSAFTKSSTPELSITASSPPSWLPQAPPTACSCSHAHSSLHTYTQRVSVNQSVCVNESDQVNLQSDRETCGRFLTRQWQGMLGNRCGTRMRSWFTELQSFRMPTYRPGWAFCWLLLWYASISWHTHTWE